MKKFHLKALTAIAALYAAPAFATTTTFLDTTKDYAYSGFGPSGYTGFGFTGSAPSTGDFLGDGFDTEKLTVIETPGQIEFKYVTSFNGDDSGAHYADIFLAPTNDLTSAPAAWAFGISLGSAANNFQGAQAAGLYSIGSTSDYMTSQQIWGPKGTGWVYGGGYIAPDGSPNLSPTRVTGGTAMAGWSVSSSVSASGEAGYPYIVDVILTAPSLAAYGLVFNTPDLDIFWGTGDCSNDALFAPLDAPARVPEPLTLAIFGAGFAGAVVIRRRRKASRA